MNLQTIPKGIDPKAVEAKMAVGLTQEQAVQMLVAQLARRCPEGRRIA